MVASQYANIETGLSRFGFDFYKVNRFVFFFLHTLISKRNEEKRNEIKLWKIMRNIIRKCNCKMAINAETQNSGWV